MSDTLMLTFVLLAAAAVVAFIALVRTRRRDAAFDPDATPDVIEYMTMMIGVVYAIVLGLAIAGVWDANDGAQATVSSEAFALHEISEQAAALPPDVRDKLRSQVDAYVPYAVGEEWDGMEDGKGLTDRGDRMLGEVRQTIQDYEPRTESQNRAAYAIAEQVTTAEQARTTRALDAGPTLPQLVWFGLIAGALVSVGMVFALQIRRTKRELILAGLFTALLAFLLGLVWVLNTPYGPGGISMTDAFDELFPSLT
ncbi:DUF4239 domain-containing protein [Streptomyces sp. A7024]|uniref:DUF4239 domain-containing protein n=1 Tax=Streptomyces coryli TaxID=1128680 RepID=A0A6G4UDM9_9ACTN|nr:DUF4239 domain-containing protein [Streptomyces coryli]NGN70274.1 DUF4239 domain-containing protein [Streptomyces coryli]